MSDGRSEWQSDFSNREILSVSPKFINIILSVSSLIWMQEVQTPQFLSLDKTEDQLVIATFILVLVSFFFGLQPDLLYALLWGATGIGALLCIYFAFPNMWPYALLLYVAYAIVTFGLIIMIFWYDVLTVSGISIPIMIGIFLIAAAFYIAFYIVQHIKKARDAMAVQEKYLPLGFWSIGVMLFVGISIISIIGWTLWVNTGGGEIQIYLVSEPLIALLLVYILWFPDRNIDWSMEKLPKSPAQEYIMDKSRVLKVKVARVKNECPECGLKLKREKKTCPSCDNVQTFGWCVKSEAFVLPCSHCQNMTLYGKGNCQKCGKPLSEKIVCNSCESSFPIKEWVAKT